MPPRAARPGAAAAGAGAGAAAAAPPLDPEAETERRLLIEQCKAMKAQRILEEAQLAQFFAEKNRLHELWLAAKKESEETKARLRAKERERDDLAEAHAVEIKVYKQRIKHLLFEHQSEATDSRTEGQVALKLAQEAHRSSEWELKSDRRDLAAVLREMESSHEDFLKALKMEHDRAITELRLEFERDTRELLAVYEDRMQRTREELNKAREDEIRAIERRKSKHIAALVAAHEKAFADIKVFYNEITHSNLELIKNRKDQLERLQLEEAEHERSMFAIAQENKRMSEPMQKAVEDVRRMTAERDHYRTDLADLEETKAHILVVTERLERLKWENEILEQRYLRLVGERDALYERFQHALHDVKQKSGFRHLLLEKRLAAATEEVERQNVALSEVLKVARLEPAALGRLEAHLASVMASKDAAIRDLKAELGRVATAHDRLIETYEKRLAEYGIPLEELGFVPARSADIVAELTSGVLAATQRVTGGIAGAGGLGVGAGGTDSGFGSSFGGMEAGAGAGAGAASRHGAVAAGGR